MGPTLATSTNTRVSGEPSNNGRWVAVAVRYSIYALAMAASLVGVLVGVRSHELYDVIRERGPVEIGQLLLLTASSVVFWLAGRRALPTFSRLAALGLALALVRELDSFFNQVVAKDSWKIPAGVLALGWLILLVRRRHDLLRELPETVSSAWFGLLFAGLVTVMIVSRLFGWQGPWETALGDSYSRWVPRAFEELAELAGYMLVLFASIEGWIAAAAGSSRGDRS